MKSGRKPVLFAALIALILLAAWAIARSGPDLEMLQDALARLEGVMQRHPVATWLGYFAAYVAVAALSLPLAVWMTLGAGALFGFGPGLLLVSFASTIGATLAFLAARHLMSDWVHARLGDRLKSIDEGMKRDGAFYLFTLRLIPAVPFFALNLAMGLTPIRTLTFYVASQLGMLPATAIYVNAGTQLSAIEDPSDILSLPVILSLVALGLFPWVARGAVGLWRRRQVYSGWQRPRRFDRNLIVIGAGSAGLVSAYIAAAVRARVTLVEADRMGGDCLNTGCVPSKALIRSAKLAHQMRHADRFGLTPVEPEIPFRQVFRRIEDVIKAIEPHDSVERYRGLGVEVLQGHARLIDPWTVEIAGADGLMQRLTARSIILATGARPFVPPIPGLEEVGYLTSDTLWQEMRERDHAPRTLAVLGGGPIGCELAQAFARLGAHVIQIEMADRLLLREDPEVSEIVRDALSADGVEVLTGHRAVAFGRDESGKWVEVEADGARRRIRFDDVIVAVGRQARLEGHGLEDLGIETGRVIRTNEFLQTRFPNILAAGDVAGPFQFTHAASHQAWFATVNALFGGLKRFKVSYRVMPWATFTDPEVARVGLNESEAREKGIAYEITRYPLDDLDRAIADGAARGFVKVLTPPGKDRILGVTIVGEHAGDIMAEFVYAMKQGHGLGRILSTIHIYPTLSEAAKNTAGQWRRGHVNETALSLLRRFHDWQRG